MKSLISLFLHLKLVGEGLLRFGRGYGAARSTLILSLRTFHDLYQRPPTEHEYAALATKLSWWFKQHHRRMTPQEASQLIQQLSLLQ